MNKTLKIGDYVVALCNVSPGIIEDEIIQIKDIKNNKIVLHGYGSVEYPIDKFEYYDYYNIPYEDGTYPKRGDK